MREEIPFPLLDVGSECQPREGAKIWERGVDSRFSALLCSGRGLATVGKVSWGGGMVWKGIVLTSRCCKTALRFFHGFVENADDGRREAGGFFLSLTAAPQSQHPPHCSTACSSCCLPSDVVVPQAIPYADRERCTQSSTLVEPH